VRQIRLSTLRYTRAKICGLCHAELEIRITHAYFLTVVKDRRSVQQFPIGTSPLPAECGIGLEPKSAKKRTDNKKPGDERRANPFIVSDALYARTERMCSKLVLLLPGIRNQPHLLGRRQTRSVSRQPGESGHYQHQRSIAIFLYSSSTHPKNLFNGFVKIHRVVEITKLQFGSSRNHAKCLLKKSRATS